MTFFGLLLLGYSPQVVVGKDVSVTNLQTSDASCCAVGQQVQLFGLLNFLRGKNTPLLFNSSFVIKINFLSALRIEKAPASGQMLPQL